MLTRMFVAITAITTLAGCSKFQLNKDSDQDKPTTPMVTTFTAGDLEIKGKTTGFGRLRKDRYVDFALVMPAISRSELIFLDMNSLLSPEVDTIKVPMSSFEVPSNLTFPNQRESYILPITLNKPGYRFYVNEPGVYKMVATHGKFPLKKVIDDVRAGKSMFDVINYFEFIQSGFKDVSAVSSIANQNIDVSQVAFNKTMTIKAPHFAAHMAAVSIALQAHGELLAPTDLKNLTSNTSQRLKTSSLPGKRYVATLMRKNDVMAQTADIHVELHSQADDVNFNEMTLALQTESELTNPPVFLPLVRRPEKVNAGLNVFPPESRPDTITPLGTHVVLEAFEYVIYEGRSVEKTHRIWQQTYSEWVKFVQQPEINPPLPFNKYRWVVMFLAKNKDTNPPTDEIDFSKITHVSRNALEIK